MNCSNPFVSAGLAFGCGQCMPCRINRRRIWATRLIVEGKQYKDNAFVTLTYDPEHCPDSLIPTDLQSFMRRLRDRFAYHTDGRKLRFFACGEYGDENERPHFHLILFNFPTCIYRRTRKGVSSCCVWCDMVRDAWGKGFVFLGELEDDSAGYVCGYVTKKMTAKDDPRLKGRHPEFARMSLKPGIGANAMFDVADTLLNYQNTLDTLSDVPNALQIGREKRPLGRYLTKKLRTYVGRDEKAPQSKMDEIASSLQDLRLAAREDDKNPSLKAKIIESGSTKRASQKFRQSLYPKRRTL